MLLIICILIRHRIQVIELVLLHKNRRKKMGIVIVRMRMREAVVKVNVR